MDAQDHFGDLMIGFDLWSAMAIGWFVLVLGVATRWAPRVRRPLPSLGPPGPTAVEWAGRRLRAAARRPPDKDRDLRLGRSLGAGLAMTVVDVRLSVIIGFGVFILHVTRHRSRRRRFEASVAREMPELIELLGVALTGQGSILRAVEAVGERPIGPVSRRLALVSPMVGQGHRLGDALSEVAADLGDQVRPLMRALVGSEHYGTQLGDTLRRLALEARDHRRRRAQIEARRVPIKLLMPLVLGVLPAFVLLTVVPTLAGTFSGLDLGGTTAR